MSVLKPARLAHVAEPAVGDLFVYRQRSCDLIIKQLKEQQGSSVSRLRLLLSVRAEIDDFRPRYCLRSLDGDLDWLEEQGRVQLNDCFVELRSAISV